MLKKPDTISFDLVLNTTVGQQIYAKKNKQALNVILLLKRFLVSQPSFETYGKARRNF